MTIDKPETAVMDRVSIIIPTFNRCGLLVQAIESALQQRYENMEVLVSDNASTDDTQGVVQKFLGDARFKYRRNDQNIGMVRNWREALKACSGDWFMILSDDDYFVDPDYVQKAMTLARGKDDVNLAYASGYILDEDNGNMEALLLPFEGIVDGKAVFMSRNMIGPMDFTLCNVLFRKSAAIRHAAFHNVHNVSGDSELFLRLAVSGRVAVCPDLVSVYRRHATNLTGNICKNFQLLLNNHEMALGPYVYAVTENLLTEQERLQWHAQVVTPVFRFTVANMRRFHRDRLAAVLSYFDSRYGHTFWSALDMRRRIQMRVVMFVGKLRGTEAAIQSV